MSAMWGLTAPIALIAFYLFQKQQNKSQGNAPTAAASTPASGSAAAAPAGKPAPAAKAASSRSRPTYKGDKLKMVLVVRNDLGMGKGKMCAQCCHAAVGVVSEMMETDPDMLEHWENHGAMKIALKAQSEDDLDRLEAAADAEGLANYLVVDAGHTQIAPDTKTVLAIGPAPAKILDKLTGHLKLM